MRPVNRLAGFLRQRVIVGQAILLKKLQGGGHLFQIVELGPMLITWALALGHALLNVNDKVDLLPWSRAAACGRRPGRGLAVNDGLHILRPIPIPQRGAPPAGGSLIAGELE